MKEKLLVLIISILIVCLVVGFVIYRTVTMVKVIKLVERSAINDAEQNYEDVDLKMAAWVYNFEPKEYAIVLYDKKHKGVTLRYTVTPIVNKDGYYYVIFTGGQNEEVLTKKKK